MSDKTDELLSKREQTHGPAAETFNVGIQLINVGPDHWDDIEGYARLGKKIQEESNNGERRV